jgi:hypothetical protein
MLYEISVTYSLKVEGESNRQNRNFIRLNVSSSWHRTKGKDTKKDSKLDGTMQPEFTVLQVIMHKTDFSF